MVFQKENPHRMFRAYYIRQQEGWCLHLWCLQSLEVGDLKKPHTVWYLKSSPVWKTSQWPLGIVVFLLAAPWSGNTLVLFWTEFECEHQCIFFMKYPAVLLLLLAHHLSLACLLSHIWVLKRPSFFPLSA